MRQLPAPLAGINLQHGLLAHRGELVKTLEADDGRIELRAVTGPDYGRIWDHELVEAVMRIAGDGTGDTRWKVPGLLDWSSMTHNPFVEVTKDTTTLYASDRDVFLFLVDDAHPIEAGRLPNGDPDLYFRGFYCWNSEVGSKTLGIASFYLRAVCMNRNIWGAEGFEEISIRHSKFAGHRFAHQATPALERFAHSSSAPFVAGIRAARDTIVARKDEDRENVPEETRLLASRNREDHCHRARRRRPSARERLRLRARHHRARACQAASGCQAGSGGQGRQAAEGRRVTGPGKPQPRLPGSSRCPFCPLLIVGSSGSPLSYRGRGEPDFRDGLKVERESRGRLSRRKPMAQSSKKSVPMITLSSSRDIPFNKLLLSQANVRHVKAGVSIEELAEDIARRGLLMGLSVRAVVDEAGVPTGMFEIPAGGRRYRALALLVKQRRLAKTASVPCVVRTSGLAEEDSLAENIQRAPLHPLDQFRAFLALREKGQSEEEIAANQFVSVAVVKQRLRLASVSPRLLDVYAEDGMTLDQLMAFTVNGDHTRQEQVFERISASYDKAPYIIRRMLTEGAVQGFGQTGTVHQPCCL